MRRALTLSTLILAGCAAPAQTPRIFTPEEVHRMSVVQLCIGVAHWGPISAGNAAIELSKRSVDCKDYSGAMQAALQAQAQDEQQRRALAAAYFLQMQRQQQPAATMYQAPPAVTCTTQHFGAISQSVCR